MYARVIQFQLAPGQRNVVEESTRILDPMVKEQPGFKGVTYYGDDNTGEFGCVLLWDSVDSADRGAEVLRPHLTANLGDKFQSVPTFKLFEVYEV